MRLLIGFLTVIFLMCAVAPAALAANDSSITPKMLRIGIVLSVGGLGDHAFNDAAYAGVQNLRRLPDCLVDVIEPGDVAAIESGLEFLAGRHADLVAAVGIFANEAVRRVATKYPQTRFVLLDSVVELPNVLSVLFNEEEGSFYAGAFAGLLTKSQTIGFLGGMTSPVIASFEKGFRNGIAFVNPQAKLLVRYAGDTPEAFNDPETGKKLGLELAAGGADFVYHAAGRTGLGLIDASRRAPFLVIGVDGDQSGIAPGKVAASMIKRLDVALDNAVRAIRESRFKGGVLTLGLADAGIELDISRFNAGLVTPLVQQRLQEVEAFLLHRTPGVGSPSAPVPAGK
ncbi:MAG TPA: BMP family ABC transporter substrate-binding protein [Candidatus Ozemobacteraceae bacterium]